ncbi:MAG: group 1 truncated hemoglobin [Planctomycetes bacterium]|nr:group 1 truncated hemoglobin [Planctomycetota bacterium]
MNQTVTTTLFARIGGTKAIQSIVADLFRRALADNDLKGYYDGIDMNKLTDQYVKFLSATLGGMKQYTGKGLRKAHNRFGLTDRHFERFTDHMAEAMRGADIDESEIEEAMAMIMPLKKEIVAG